MANKAKSWRPDDGFYKALREEVDKVLPGEYSDHEMVQLFAVSWLAGQSDALPFDRITMPEWGGDQSEALSKLNERIEIIAESTSVVEINKLKEGMKKLHLAMKALNESNPSSATSNVIAREEFMMYVERTNKRLDNVDSLLSDLIR